MPMVLKVEEDIKESKQGGNRWRTELNIPPTLSRIRRLRTSHLDSVWCFEGPPYTGTFLDPLCRRFPLFLHHRDSLSYSTVSSVLRWRLQKTAGSQFYLLSFNLHNHSGFVVLISPPFYTPYSQTNHRDNFQR